MQIQTTQVNQAYLGVKTNNSCCTKEGLSQAANIFIAATCLASCGFGVGSVGQSIMTGFAPAFMEGAGSAVQNGVTSLVGYPPTLIVLGCVSKACSDPGSNSRNYSTQNNQNGGLLELAGCAAEMAAPQILGGFILSNGVCNSALVLGQQASIGATGAIPAACMSSLFAACCFFGKTVVLQPDAQVQPRIIYQEPPIDNNPVQLVAPQITEIHR